MGKSVVYNSVLTILRQVIGIVIGMLSAMIIARMLGADGQGKYALIILLPNMFYTLFNIGLPASTVYYIGQKKYLLEDVFKTNLLIAVILSVVTGLLSCLFVYFYQDVFYEQIEWSILAISLISLPFIFLNKNMQVIFQGKEEFEKFNLIVILNQLGVFVFCIVFLIVLGWGLLGAVAAFVSSQLLIFLALFYFLKQEFNLSLLSGRFSKSYFRNSFSYGLKGHISNILAFINYRVDLFIIAYFLNDVSVGLYSVAVTVVERIWVVSQSVSTVLFARVSNLSTDIERAKFTAIVARNVLFISLIGGVLLYCLGGWIINFLFGAEFVDAVGPFILLIPGVVLLSFARILSNFFSGIGKPEINTYVASFTTVLNIGMNIYLVPKFGVAGAAIATSITYASNMLIKTTIFGIMNKMSFLEFLLVRPTDLNLYKKYINKALKK